ncbi:MAG: DUF5657 family protein [Patescibacteria group bacterium]
MTEIPLIGVSVWLVAKIFALVAFLIYIVFAVVVVRQVQLMTDTLEVGFETVLRFLSFAHLAFALIVFLAALIVL